MCFCKPNSRSEFGGAAESLGHGAAVNHAAARRHAARPASQVAEELELLPASDVRDMANSFAQRVLRGEGRAKIRWVASRCCRLGECGKDELDA